MGIVRLVIVVVVVVAVVAVAVVDAVGRGGLLIVVFCNDDRC